VKDPKHVRPPPSIFSFSFSLFPAVRLRSPCVFWVDTVRQTLLDALTPVGLTLGFFHRETLFFSIGEIQTPAFLEFSYTSRLIDVPSSPLFPKCESSGRIKTRLFSFSVFSQAGTVYFLPGSQPRSSFFSTPPPPKKFLAVSAHPTGFVLFFDYLYRFPLPPTSQSFPFRSFLTKNFLRPLPLSSSKVLFSAAPWSTRVYSDNLRSGSF